MKNGTFIDATTVHQLLKMIREENKKMIHEIIYRKHIEETYYNLKNASLQLGMSVNTLKKRIRNNAIKQREIDKKISGSEIRRYKALQ